MMKKSANKKSGNDKDPVINVSEGYDEGLKVMKLVRCCGYVREDDTPQEAAVRTASLALVLANIAAGHLRGGVEGEDYDLGINFVLEGGFLVSDFVSLAIDRLCLIQDRWERNLLYDLEPDASEREQNEVLSQDLLEQRAMEALFLPKPVLRRVFAVCTMKYAGLTHHGNNKWQYDGAETTAAQQLSQQQNQAVYTAWHPPRDRTLMPEDKISVPLTEFRRATLCREALEYPVFISRGSSNIDWQDRSTRAHLGRMLIHEHLNSSVTLDLLQKTLADTGKRHKSGQNGVQTRTNLVLSANHGVLDEWVAGSSKLSQMASRLLWLVESAPECDLSHQAAVSPEVILSGIGAKYRRALKFEIYRRINFTDNDVRELSSLNGQMVHWRSFLREQEKYSPGISQSVSNLPVALCYGLESMDVHRTRVDGDHVIAMAKWLVRRMMNRISLASSKQRDHKLEDLAKQLADKLATSGPMKVRDLMRKFSNLNAARCRDGLALLADKGIVGEQNGIWGILVDSNINSTSPRL